MKLFFKKYFRGLSWYKTRKLHLLSNPRCVSCGGAKNIEVHHIIPISHRPEMKLDPGNLMTLCEAKKYGVNCHLNIGHNGNYRRVNKYPHKTAKAMRMRVTKFSKKRQLRA